MYIQGRSTGRLVCHSLLPLSNTADSMKSCTNSKAQVCFEFLFDSVRPTAVLPCGHTIHSQCLKDLQKARTSTCPICMKSYGDMARVRRCYSLFRLSVSSISDVLSSFSEGLGYVLGLGALLNEPICPKSYGNMARVRRKPCFVLFLPSLP